jgi:hypothetical protein
VSRAQRRNEWRLLAGHEQALTSVATPWPTTVLWRWRYETGLVAAVAGLAAIAAQGVFWPAALAVVAVAAGAAIPAVRRPVLARAWCVITEHRIRSGCAQARIHSRQGRLPAVLVTSPRPFGERVLLWCPACTSADDFESARDLLAAACWSADIRIERDARRAHLVSVEVIRRPAGPSRNLVARAERHSERPRTGGSRDNAAV